MQCSNQRGFAERFDIYFEQFEQCLREFHRLMWRSSVQKLFHEYERYRGDKAGFSDHPTISGYQLIREDTFMPSDIEIALWIASSDSGCLPGELVP